VPGPIAVAFDAGFDGIELHGTHGFLIRNFFSPLYNQREDQWGDTLENRMRFRLLLSVRSGA
jgi:2,4-dienoyl-CoA reductase (NADPH2)